MNFKVTKIRDNPPALKHAKFKFNWKIIALLTLTLVLGITVAAKFKFFGPLPKRFLSFSTLKKDNFGHTNILLLGVAGHAEEGGNLSDAMMICSSEH